MTEEHRICPETRTIYDEDAVELDCDLYELHGGPHWNPWFGEWEYE